MLVFRSGIASSLVLVLAACGPAPCPAVDPAGPSPETAAGVSAEPSPPPPIEVVSDEACGRAVPAEPVSLNLRPGESAMAYPGLDVSLDGISTDDFDDGTFDANAALRIRLGEMESPWLPSLLAEADWVRFGIHCLRVRPGPDDGVTVEAFPLPPAAAP